MADLTSPRTASGERKPPHAGPSCGPDTGETHPSSDARKTAEHWSEHTSRYGNRNAGLFWWEAGPEIGRRINRKVSGDADLGWLPYTLQKHFDGRLPMERCLSLACGSGDLERELAGFGAFRHCDAFDIAEGSIEAARRLADERGFGHIRYSVIDVNTMTLPHAHYDCVWANSALHHFHSLEHVCEQVARSLKPGGLFILNEYVGPNRFQFPPRQVELANLCLQLIPARYRALVEEEIETELTRTRGQGLAWIAGRFADKVRDGDLLNVLWRRIRAYRARAGGRRVEKTAVVFPSPRDVVAADPSEAIRSEDIMKVVEHHFEILEKKDLGGNILQFLLAGIAGNFPAADEAAQAVIRMLIGIEDGLLACGELKSDFAYVVARPWPPVR